MAGYDGPITDKPTEPCAKTFTWLVDGKEVTVTLTIDEKGVVTAKIKSEVDMDVNALYWGDDDGTGDFEGFKKKDSSLNMNGEGSQYEGEAVLWDDAQKISSPGSKDGGYIQAGEYKEFTLNMDAETFDNLVYFGIRATSVGEDGEDSLKLVGKPEDCPPEEDDCTDHFPDLERDISYVNFVFKLNEDASDEAMELDRNGDGYVTVKIEIPDGYDPTDCANNLDNWYKDALTAIYEEYPALIKNSTEEGAFIKGGVNLFEAGDNVWSHGSDNNIAYFSYDDDPGNDKLPDGFKTDAEGNIVATGQPANRYDDGNSVAFDPAWVPEECDCVA